MRFAGLILLISAILCGCEHAVVHPVGHWKLDDVSNAATLMDSSGCRRGATLGAEVENRLRRTWKCALLCRQKRIFCFI